MLVLVGTSFMRMGVFVIVRMRMSSLVLLAVVKAGTVGVLVFVFMRMRVFMLMFVGVPGFVRVRVGMIMGVNPDRVFSRQSASTISTHYSISREATSISRPARSWPLGLWQSGHSANISSD